MCNSTLFLGGSDADLLGNLPLSQQPHHQPYGQPLPANLMQPQLGRAGSAAGAPKAPNSGSGRSGKKKEKDIAEWFSLFAELDPLSNPDQLGGPASNKDCL